MRFLFRMTLFVLFVFSLQSGFSFAFSFSEYDNETDSTTADKAEKNLAALKCPASFKNKKIATMIGEQHRDDRYSHYATIITVGDPDFDYRFGTKKSVYGPLIDELNQSFSQLGLKTYTGAEINDQIAREEQEAFLNNDVEAALSAATRLKADFLLKGIISTRAQTNKVVKIEEVFVTITLTLHNSESTQLTTARVSEAVFSDADTLGTIQRLVKEQSRSITYQLFKDYCRKEN